MKLVKFLRDWADEFEAEGFGILSDEEWEEFVKVVKENPNAETSFWFGTNEGWEDETIESFYDCYKTIDLPYEEEIALQRLFGKVVDFGVFPHPLELIENLNQDSM